MAEDGRALIADFGFSFSASDSPNLAHKGGTKKWMALELWDDPATSSVASVQSDIWSFGMTALVSLVVRTVSMRSKAGISRNSSSGRSPSMENQT